MAISSNGLTIDGTYVGIGSTSYVVIIDAEGGTGASFIDTGGTVDTNNHPTGLNTTASQIFIIDADVSSWDTNDAIKIDDEIMRITQVLASNRFTVTRGYDNTTAVAHSAGSAIYFADDRYGTSPDTFKWSNDGGQTYVETGVACSTSYIVLSDDLGLEIKFSATTGFEEGDRWNWTSELLALTNIKDGVLLSKDGVHNLAAMTDGEIGVMNDITNPDGVSKTESRVTSTESAMKVHNKEVHIGHGKDVSSTWAGYVDNDQWGKKTEGFHVTDANVSNYSAISYADYICSDETDLFFGSYRGGTIFKAAIAAPTVITKNTEDFKDICGMIYDDGELWVLICDSVTSDNYTLHQVNTDDLTIEYSHILVLPTDAFVGEDEDYSSGGVIFSDMIITGSYIWFAAYKDSKVEEEVVLWNCNAPDADADDDLTLINRSPGIREGTAVGAPDGSSPDRADEGWIGLQSRHYPWGHTYNDEAYHVNSWYNTLYKKSLVRVDSSTVGWLCQYAPSEHVGSGDGIERVLRVSEDCAEANNSSQQYGEHALGWGANTYFYGAGYNEGNFMNIIKANHVAGSYEDNTAGLILLSNGVHGGSLSPLQTSVSGDGLFMCSNQEIIERYGVIGANTVDTHSKWYSKHPPTVESADINSSCKLGYYDTSGDIMYMITADKFPTIDKIEYNSGWDDYTPDIIESIPLILEIETIGDGDDASVIDKSGGISSSDSQIPLEDVNGFAYGGSIVIEGEIITYTGRSADTDKLTGCKRGKFGTTAADHENDTTVEQARAKYFWKTSYVYDGYQESPLTTYTTPSTGLAGGAPNFDVTLTYTGINDLEPRITHINLYRASNTDLSKDEPEGFFRLVKSIPLDDKGWDVSAEEASYLVKDIKSATVAYDARTGISEVVPHTSINYGLSTEINSMLIIGRGKLEEIDDVEQYLFKSKVHNYDIFDWTEDLLKLPRVPTALASFSGRIYAFDENNTYRINPSGFYIEDTFEGVGCIGPKAVITTEFGMFFCDDTNIYLHNGTNAAPIGDSIARGDDNYAWQNRDTSFVPIVGFEPKRGSFLVFFKPTGVSGYFVWAYNLARKRWDLWEFHDTYVPQCVIAGPNGEVYVGTDKLILHYLAGTDHRTWEYQTKEITLGADTQDKRFYKIKKIGTATLTYGVNDSTPVQTLTDEKLQTAHKKSKSIKIRATSQNGEVDSLGIVYRRLSVK
jgi:hypothetical protein